MSGTVPPPAQTWVSSHPGATRRVSGAGVLLAAAVVVRGTGGVLLGILATLVLLDAVVPMPAGTRTQADDRFRAAVRARRRARGLARLRGRQPERLDVLDDRSGWAATAERRALGVQLIAIASVTGTAETLKARAFDRAFRPEAESREHWKRLWLAHAHGAALPTVSVFRVGGPPHARGGAHPGAGGRG